MTDHGDRSSAAFTGAIDASMKSDGQNSVLGFAKQFVTDRQLQNLAATIATTFATFAIFLIQGIIIARLLGPAGRGEFGSCLYFPRDVLLYAGLLGGIEIITTYSARNISDPGRLRGVAARLGFLTGCITAVIAGLLAFSLLTITDRMYLIPYALFCCLFVPLEHMQLTMSAVDRGAGDFAKYNWNRLFFAVCFPVVVAAAWWIDLPAMTDMGWLPLLCGAWVFSRIAGVIPTLFPGPRVAKQVLDQRSGFADSPQVPNVRSLLIEGRPYALSMLVSEVFERLDIFLVLALCSLVDAGNYFVALPAAAMLTIVPSAIGVFTFNYGARERGTLSTEIALRAMFAMAIIQLITALLFSLVVDDLILFFFSDRFAAAIPLVMLLLPAFAIKGFLQVTDSFLKGRGQPMTGTLARLSSIVVMLGFVAITWTSLGLPAIPIAAGVGQALSMFVIAGAVLRECRRNTCLTGGKK